MNFRSGIRLLVTLVLLITFTACGVDRADPSSPEGSAELSRPNILWISLEDITPMMGCYGGEYARTPVFDSLAAEGIRYT